MGLLERAHKVLGDALRKLGGHATSEWIDFIAIITAWRNSSINRDLGVSPHEAFFCRKSTFAYDRLGLDDVISITPNDLGNLCAAMDVCVRVRTAVSSAQVTAQYDGERSAPPVYKVGSTVLVYFPDRETKCLTFYRGPFEILSAHGDCGNYYNVRDLIQFNEYTVHVERLTPFDMSRTSLPEQAARQLPSRDFGIIVGVDGHRMSDTHGQFEFCIRFYSGYRAWQLFPYVQNLDVVKQYVILHKLNTRKQTPVQQFGRLTGQKAVHATVERPMPQRTIAPAAPLPPPSANLRRSARHS